MNGQQVMVARRQGDAGGLLSLGGITRPGSFYQAVEKGIISAPFTRDTPVEHTPQRNNKN
jgi:hypothetical protein